MDKKRIIRNEIIVNSICIIFIVMVFISFSLGVFMDTDVGGSNVINFGDIEMTFCDNDNCMSGINGLGKVVGVDGQNVPISIYPTTQSSALAQDAYRFILTNSGSLPLTINIIIESSIITGGSSYTNTPESNIYVAFQEEGIGSPVVSLLSELNNGILGTTTLEPNASKIYRLWTWVREDASNLMQGTYFTANVRVQGEFIPYSEI